jgi:phosphatidylglycerol lysyltransferase
MVRLQDPASLPVVNLPRSRSVSPGETNSVSRSSTALAPGGAAADTDSELLEEFAYRYGRSYDSYLVTEPGRELFWSRGRRGVVAFVRRGKYLSVGGGLLAPESEKESLLREFVADAVARNLVVSFYNIAEDELPLFRRCGFQATKWGEDAIVDLPNRTWHGKEFEWVRRQTNFCRRQGLLFSECHPELMTADRREELFRELAEVSAASQAAKPQAHAMHFLDGCFDPQTLGRKRLFAARSQPRGGRIEGFLMCNPGLNGEFWALEVYRHRPDAVRGTVAFLMHQVLELLRGEGIEHASLCLVPALRCHEPHPGDCAWVRWSLRLSQQFNLVFDTAGLYHFKSRFRPRFESRYLCALPRATPGSVWAFLQICGALDLDFRKLVRIVHERWRKRRARATLSNAPEVFDSSR